MKRISKISLKKIVLLLILLLITLTSIAQDSLEECRKHGAILASAYLKADSLASNRKMQIMLLEISNRNKDSTNMQLSKKIDNLSKKEKRLKSHRRWGFAGWIVAVILILI